MIFDLQIASQLVSDINQFPVDFDLAWKWLGYYDKATAKRALLTCGFITDIDLSISTEPELPTITGFVNPNPKQSISLTVECFKIWAMMAGTEQGKKVRQYFLDCETIAKQVSRERPKAVSDDLAFVDQALDLIFKNTSIKPELIAGLKLNAAQKLNPSCSHLIEEARQYLINSTAQESRLLNPTDIGAEINLSAKAVNLKLIELGLQVKNEPKKSRKEPAYLPTAKGKQFAELTLSTGKGRDSTSYQQLRWYETVIPELTGELRLVKG